MIGKDGRAVLASRSPGKHLAETVTEKDVVSEYHRNSIVRDEIRTENEGVREAGRMGLFGIAKANPPLPAVPQQPLELASV